MKIKYLIIAALFFLQNCGYTPIYNNLENTQYKINLIEIRGDDSIIENFIASKINNLSKKDAKEIINLKISYSVKRETLLKNKKNEITNYLIIQNIKFDIKNNKNLNKLFEFNDETKIENINDQFELEKYQDEIIKNFIDLKINEFILKVSTL
tara:strand:- start:358 stop:816 length:459 start_codon:yes stop_codon:yes gene_type:complete